MKHKLYKLAALAESTVLIITMGACSKNVETNSIAFESPVSYTEQIIEDKKEETSVKINESFSIFEDPELLDDISYKEVTFPEEEKIETKEDKFISRFSSQNQLEGYLEQLYFESGLNYWQIINDNKNKEEDGEFYSYRNDLSAAAAYMLLKDNGISLKDVALELDYLLILCINPTETTENDRKVLMIFYNLCGEGYNIFEIFEQLALETHIVNCNMKEKHAANHGWICCSNLEFDTINRELMEREKIKENSNCNDNLIAKLFDDDFKLIRAY